MTFIPRKKSPRAPSMALSEAIERVQKAYAKERLRPAPTDVVAQNLGYKNANSGSAMAAIASLRYYGLLERSKDGFLAVTNDFEHFKFAPDDRQRKALLVGFLRKPPLYEALLEKYESGLPSDATLRFELIQRGFSTSAAEGALVVFRRSVNCVDQPHGEDAAQVLAIPPREGGVPMEATAPHSHALANKPSAPLPVEAHPALPVHHDGTDQIPIRLPGGRRAWLIIPTPFFASDKQRLKAQIDLLLTQDEEDS